MILDNYEGILLSCLNYRVGDMTTSRNNSSYTCGVSKIPIDGGIKEKKKGKKERKKEGSPADE